MVENGILPLKKYLLLIFILISFILLIPDYGKNHDRGYTSSELTVQEQGEKIEYTNKSARLTYSIDRHYAAIARNKDDEGRTVKETYFDADNRPTAQPAGYYGISYAYHDSEVIVTYLDKNGEPTKISSGYSIIKRTLDSKNRPLKDFFYDKKMNQVKCRAGYYGVKYEYDAEGHNSTQMFLDKDGNACHLSNGVFGYKYLRDKTGKTIEIIFLDQNERETDCNEGYSREVITYYRDGSWKSSMYLDKENRPIRLSKGQYGIKIIGNVRLLLGQNGDVKICFDNVMSAAPFLVIFSALILCVLMRMLPRKPFLILFCAYLIFIIYETLMFRETGSVRANIVPFSCYRSGDRTQIMGGIENIWLFIPFGAGLMKLGKKRGLAVLISLFFSLAIETAQYFTGLGIAEFDDVFNNTLGGVIGALMAEEIILLKSRRDDLHLG